MQPDNCGVGIHDECVRLCSAEDALRQIQLRIYELSFGENVDVDSIEEIIDAHFDNLQKEQSNGHHPSHAVDVPRL